LIQAAKLAKMMYPTSTRLVGRRGFEPRSLKARRPEEDNPSKARMEGVSLSAETTPPYLRFLRI